MVGVALGEVGGVGGEEPPPLRREDPFPRRPEDADRQALHVPRRDVDQQVPNLPPRDGGKVLAEGVEVRAVDELRAGLDDGPGRRDEGLEVSFRLKITTPLRRSEHRRDLVRLLAHGVPGVGGAGRPGVVRIRIAHARLPGPW
jgi:hypothetical protein